MHSSRMCTARFRRVSAWGGRGVCVRVCPGGDRLGGCVWGGGVSRGVYTPLPIACRDTPPVGRKTPVKILSCPKLRLRAVIIVHESSNIYHCHWLFIMVSFNPRSSSTCYIKARVSWEWYSDSSLLQLQWKPLHNYFTMPSNFSKILVVKEVNHPKERWW